jgi:hypothetical protein
MNGVIDSYIGEDTCVTVHYTYSPGDSGNTWGPPEKCWPPEPAELDITKVMLGPHDITQFLSEADLGILCDRIEDKAGEQDEVEPRQQREEYEAEKAWHELNNPRDADYWEKLK